MTGPRTLQPLPIPTGPAVHSILPALAAALAGAGPALLPVPADDPRARNLLLDTLDPGKPIDDRVALVVATSGTTGTPKGALLTAAGLRAGAAATHARLGGSGHWLLALPAHHIAGLQVLLRSLAAGTTPTVLDVAAGFDPAAFATAVSQMPGPRRYTSLVPTQLIKALNHPAARAALAGLDAVLVGGAATPRPLLERALAAEVAVVRTYGMSETCGGCVYDGVPLDGVQVRIDDGRVVLGGATVALGYRGRPGHPAFAEPGWYRTDDLGRIDDGILQVLGRLDEAVSTGGLTVLPHVVEAVLMLHPAVRECAVFGLPDDRLGERVVAAVVPQDVTAVVPHDVTAVVPHGPADLPAVRAHVAAALGPTAAPREVFLLDELPLRGPGKVDRAALRARFYQSAARSSNN